MVAGGLSTGIYTTNSPEAVRWICDQHDQDATRWGSLPATLAQTSLSLLTRSSWKKWCRFRSMLTIILEMMIMKHDQGEEQFEPPQSGCSIFWRGEPIIIVKMWITVLTVFAKCHNSTSKIPLWLNWCIQQQSYKITTILFYRAGVYWIYIVPILPSYLGVISNTLPRACIFL